jgi:prolyl oligopeptidase
VADPYRWLENDVRVDPEVASWVVEQNKVTDAFLASIPERPAIRARIERLFDYPRYSTPSKQGSRYVFTKNDGLQNQAVVYIQDSLDAPARVLLDPNTWSTDGTIALAGMAFSDSGNLVAFAKSEAGSDWQRWRVMDVATGVMLPDEIRWSKFGGASWSKDEKGFFYTRFPEPKAGEEFQSLNLNNEVRYHRLGTPQSEDTLVFSTPEHPTWGFGAGVTEDGRYLVISVYEGTDPKNLLLIQDLNEPGSKPREIVDAFANEWSVIGNDGTTFYATTDFDAPRRRIVSFDVRKGLASLREIVPQQPEVLEGAGMVGDFIFAQYLKDVRPLVRMLRPDGSLVRDVELPGIGSAGGFGGRRRDTETFYSFASFNQPPTSYRLELATGKSTLFRRTEVDFDGSAYEVKQVFYTSKDGTRVPMFVVQRKGAPRDGSQPTLLYGYGGFNASMTPWFSPTFASWLDLGGTLAVANLRGGGEYGREWHEAGKRLLKQNVFDDFIAAAEHLIAGKWTSPERLAIQGGSNGGLLVGAVMAQRPELFGAALPAVGVMDMLRFQRFTAGRYWTDDYGSSDNPEEFKALYAYSPYHNLKPGTAYPPTMVTTADTDDRVVPGHSFKFAARLQECHAGEAPVLIRIETAAGHGAGKPVSKMIEETADMWAFLVKVLKMTPKGLPTQ